MPSMEVTVKSASNSLKTCNTCEMHSQPALVESAYWNGEVAASTAGPNCWATVLATSHLMTSPTTIPRTPPSFFRRTVIRPIRRIWTVLSGTTPLEQEIMHFDFGQEPAGVTDRVPVFERLVGEYETSGGEILGVQVKCVMLLERGPPQLRTHILLTCGSPPNGNRRCAW